MPAPGGAPAPGHAAALILAQAAHAVAGVVSRGRSADDALARAGADSAIRAVTLGTLRWYPQLAALAALLTAGRALVPELAALLAVALHQLQHSRHPPEASVSSAVDAVRLLRQPHATGLMNALLRRFVRERAALLSAMLADPAAACAHPAWLLAALREAWPADWERITAANNAQPPLTVRVDLSRGSLDDYCVQLAAHGLPAMRLPWLPTALVLERPVPVERLPGFAEGWVSVQDAGAQLASRLLGVRAGERVLDACAAPGGKTGALLEAADGAIDLTAVDVDAQRLARVADNLARLRRQARLVTADLAGERSWWDGQRFDRILLDAPCSAVGVIRRHPDIKLLRRPQDIGTLAALQRRILEQCLALLKPGGRLLYSTCSVLPVENQAVVEAVLAAVPAARAVPMPAPMQALLPPDARPCRHGVQLLPGNAALTDGFYYACLTVAT
ncbi:MAG TPA: 16S rRNA (cytosine(967)-C(5))-methyltransferase RsmB [Steroidobacteraceae bacterium]|nr:16S rRNA (cytosine(967)-C(5))-methyltransferase RsmB [Steroidobacteraceae bacterium]